MAGTPPDEPDKPPWIETSIDILPYSAYSRLSELELRQRGIDYDYDARFDEDQEDSYNQTSSVHDLL